jgi:hypothetical protein
MAAGRPRGSSQENPPDRLSRAGAVDAETALLEAEVAQVEAETRYRDVQARHLDAETAKLEAEGQRADAEARRADAETRCSDAEAQKIAGEVEQQPLQARKTELETWHLEVGLVSKALLLGAAIAALVLAVLDPSLLRAGSDDVLRSLSWLVPK